METIWTPYELIMNGTNIIYWIREGLHVNNSNTRPSSMSFMRVFDVFRQVPY